MYIWPLQNTNEDLLSNTGYNIYLVQIQDSLLFGIYPTYSIWLFMCFFLAYIQLDPLNVILLNRALEL